MSIYDEIDEATRDNLFAAAEQLERMTPEQLRVLADDIRMLQSDYEPESDLLTILVGVDSNYGVTGWEFTHERGMENGGPAVAGSASNIEMIETVTRGTVSGFGTTTINLFHPPGEPLAPRRVVQGIYDTIVYLIGVNDSVLFSLTTPPASEINIFDSPSTEGDVFTQQGETWGDPIVVSQEMRAPDSENHVPEVSRNELPDILSEVDAGVPMTRFQCGRNIIDCTRSSLRDQEELQAVSVAQDEEHRNELAIKDSERARGVAVVRDDYTQTKEEWTVSKVFHPECGPSAEAFEAEEDDLRLFESKGKDEVYIEGTIKFGPTPSQDEEFPHRPVYFEDITVLGRRGHHPD